MTQVELPQLSLQRYVDLVKRRSWQLVPVSLLGLLIGGLVALLIPRFYVAETLLEHQQVPSAVKNVENPFRAVVDTAMQTVPLVVGEAITELKWPEAMQLDDFTRREFERDVESRITVKEINGNDKSRSYALIRVEYRDQDGERAASFLNKLVEVWGRRRIEELRKPAEAEQLQATTNADRARRTLAGFVREKQDLERQYELDPAAEIGVQRAGWIKQEAQRQARRQALREKRKERAGLAAVIEQQRETLGDMQARVPPDATNVMAEAVKLKQARPLVMLWLKANQELNGTFRAGTAPYYRAQRKVQLLMQQIEALVPQSPVDADGLVPNPLYTALLAKITLDEGQLAELEAEIALGEKQLEEAAAKFAARIEGYGIYTQKLDAIEEAKAAKDEALAALSSATAMLTQLNRELPVRTKRPAVVPPAPTEPNILIVALVGCVLGLAVAIGLILALDFLQGSFKTLDDVQRGLPVPVLGGVAHLETVAEREQAVRSRRKVALLAGSGVAMVTVIVSIFYFDPTMLPTWVSDVLRTILGA